MDLGYVRAGGTLSLLDDRWIQSLRTAWTTTDTENSNDFGDNGSTAADKYGIYYQSSWLFTPGTPDATGDSVTLALIQEKQEFRQRGEVIVLDPNDPGQNLDPNQDQDHGPPPPCSRSSSPLRRTSVSLSARYDDNSAYDDVATYRATTAWTADGTGTRLHASYGTGQKAPTFIERFGYFPDQFVGNPDLKPETSRGWEAGVEQPLWNDRVSLGATYFHEDLEDEINGFVVVQVDPDTFISTAENLAGESRRRGVEVSARARVTPTAGATLRLLHLPRCHPARPADRGRYAGDPPAAPRGQPECRLAPARQQGRHQPEHELRRRPQGHLL